MTAPRGKLIALEGLDRAGKTSIARLIPSRLTSCRVPITTCGELQSPLAPLLWELLTSGGSALLKTFLFASDRAWTYERVLLPALKRGDLVMWDRYVDSAIAYRAVELQQSEALIDLNFVTSINSPFCPADLTIYIDIDPDTAIQRSLEMRHPCPYSGEFLEKVRSYYWRLATEKNYRVVDGTRPLETVIFDVEMVLKSCFAELFA